jgi:hypothetical protein
MRLRSEIGRLEFRGFAGPHPSTRHVWARTTDWFRCDCGFDCHGIESSQIGLQTTDFPLVLESCLAGIATIESLEALYGRVAWDRMMLDFLLYSCKGAGFFPYTPSYSCSIHHDGTK